MNLNGTIYSNFKQAFEAHSKFGEVGTKLTTITWSHHLQCGTECPSPPSTCAATQALLCCTLP